MITGRESMMWHWGDGMWRIRWRRSIMGVSPYVYCKNNLVNRIDLDGKDDYVVDSRGRLHNRTPYKERGQSSVDKLYNYSGNKKNPMGKKSITIATGLLSQMLVVQEIKEERYATYGSTQNTEDAAKVFKFAADNTAVEWKFDIYNDNGANTAVIATKQDPDHVQNAVVINDKLGVKGKQVVNMHSHPNPLGTKGGSSNDMSNAKPSPTRNVVYFKENQTLYEYNATRSQIKEMPVRTSEDILKHMGLK